MVTGERQVNIRLWKAFCAKPSPLSFRLREVIERFQVEGGYNQMWKLQGK